MNDIKKEMLDIIGEWNGDDAGREEDRADIALEVIGLITQIEVKLIELNNK